MDSSMMQLIGIKPSDLITKFQELLTKELKDLKKEYQPKQPNVYLTRNEVAEMFKIDLSSVHNWTKKGRLQSYGMGGRIYYRRDEVENAIVKL